jgi:hypothetical protein
MTEQTNNDRPLTYYQRNKDRIKKLASLNYQLKKLEKQNETQNKEVKENKRTGRKRLSPEQLLANYEARKQKMMQKKRELRKNQEPKKLGRPLKWDLSKVQLLQQ